MLGLFLGRLGRIDSDSAAPGASPGLDEFALLIDGQPVLIDGLNILIA